MSDYVHIVSLEAPSPPDYGGTIDIYNKIVAFAGIGKRIILHYFDYNKGRGAQGLEQYCHKIYKYKRHNGIRSISLRLPYMVGSRINKELIKRLNNDAHPIILEGIHCSGILKHLHSDRKIVLRLHNNEAKYYRSLASFELSSFRKLYLLLESYSLKSFQKSLPKNVTIAGVSNSDLLDFRFMGFTDLHFIPILIPWQQVNSQSGKGTYCLYHGNMKISENEEAATWLIEKVFSQCTIPFIIAGKEVSNRLIKKSMGFNHIQIVSSPSEEKMQELIRNAHINILPSANNTGVKLKLVNALFNGRFCITNQAGVEGTGIKSRILIIENGKELIEKVEHLFTIPFSEEEIEQRKTLLQLYDNQINIEKFNALIS